MERHIFIVGGIPGAGKTTVSGLLARRFERGVHLESDVLQNFIVTGGLSPDGEPADEAKRQLLMRGTNASMLADAYFEAGFTVVIDAVVVGSHLQHFMDHIRSRPLHFVLLLPRLEVVEQRDASRAGKQVFKKWGHLDEVARTETPKVGLWLDSSDMTAEETVNEILRRRDEALVR